MKSSFRTLLLNVLTLTATLASAAVASTPGTPQLRIVGGQAIDIGSAPATVALLNKDALAQTGSFFQSQFCGGTLIGSRWVLTAAHCLATATGATTPAQSISVLMGSTDLESPIYQPVDVSRVIRHSGYDEASYANDIALLQLAFDVPLDSATLDNRATQLNDLGLIAGWGALSSPDANGQQAFPTRLQGALVYMVPGSQCSELFTSYRGQVDDSQLCAGRVEGGVDSCQGDSGGPIYRYDPEAPGNLPLAGVVSWGYGCADAAAPGVYTRVAAYSNWIAGITGEVPLQDDVVAPVAVVSPAQPSLPSVEPDIGTGTAGLSSGGGALEWLTGVLLALLALCRLKQRTGGRAAPEPIPAARQRRAPLPHHVDPQTDTLCQHDISPGAGRHERSVTARLLFGALLAGSCLAQADALAQHEPEPQADLQASQLPIGAERPLVIAAASTQWQQGPECTLQRTGYGQSRRAWFLETCEFDNHPRQKVCGVPPVRIQYHFLEQTLIQVALAFEPIPDVGPFRRCVQEQAEQLSGPDQPVLVFDEKNRLILADNRKSLHVHALR